MNGDEDDDATDDGTDIAPPVDLSLRELDLNDRIPSAGAADIGGAPAPPTTTRHPNGRCP
jgi:hypothetical protein